MLNFVCYHMHLRDIIFSYMQSYLKLYYDVINVMLLSDDVTYQFVLSSVVSKHLLLALSVLCLFVELTQAV